MVTPAGQRLFFALWPDEPVRQSVARLAGKTPGRRGVPVAPANLHITLVFLGALTAGERGAAESAADQVGGEPFDIHLDTLGHWPRPRVFWLAPGEYPDALRALVSDLRAALRETGLAPELRPYQPHVTLARKVSHPPPLAEVPEICWPVRSFCLVSSVTDPRGARYEVLRTWPLGTPR